MIWNYSLSTNTIWTSFDSGHVEADTYEEARELALKELKYNLDKANTVFKHCDITKGFSIDMDYTQLVVNVADFPQKKEPMEYILILGKITFHHFEPYEIALFKTDKENKALIHELDRVLFFDNKEEMYKCADEAESYIILQEFTGEMVFENPADKVQFDFETKAETILKAPLEEVPKDKIIRIYYWRASKDDLEILGYDPQQEFPYSEAKVCEIMLDVINKGYNVQTRNDEKSFTICVDKGYFKQM